MALTDDVRRHCAAIAAAARAVTIDHDALDAYDAVPPATIDAEIHLVDGPPELVARYLLTLDSINFGSGWFPTLRKRQGRSGYATIASALAERFRLEGAWSNAQLRALKAAELADTLDQPRDHELMALYAQALRSLGRWLGERSVLAAIADSGSSAEAFATALAGGMTMFDDRGFYKRAQIAPANLALAGVAEFDDLDRLTIFADNLVPHVLRCDGVLVYDERLAAHIDAGHDLRPSPQEREIRASGCTPASCSRCAWAWRRAYSTTGCGTAASSRPTRRGRDTAAAASITEAAVVGSRIELEPALIAPRRVEEALGTPRAARLSSARADRRRIAPIGGCVQPCVPHWDGAAAPHRG